MADLTILLVHGCIATSLCIAFAGYIFNSHNIALSNNEQNKLNVFHEYPFQFIFAAAVFFLLSWGASIANQFIFKNYFDAITEIFVSLGWITFFASFLLFLQLYKDAILIYFKNL